MSNETAIASLKEKIDELNQHAWEVRVTDLPKSFELSQESVKLARSINYPKGLAEGLRSLGFSYVRFSKNDEAAPLLKESLSLYQSLNDLKGQAVIYEYLGIIERNWGNLGASLDLLLKANELVLQIGSQEIEITCSYQLGVTYKHLGDHENALDYLYKTLSLAKKMNFTLMEAYATNIIGSIYFDNGNYNEALDLYQQGLIIRRQSHDKWGEAGSLDNIGFTYLKLNDLDKAIDHCKQSLAICQATGDKKGEANALLHLGEIYEQVGDIKQAADFSNASLEIRKDRGDKRGETEVLLFLAGLYKNRSDVEDHQIFEWLSNALKIADEVKAQDLLSKTHYNLHEYYQQKGNFKESLAQLEAHFQIEKELHKNSINQKIANLEISHKAEVVSQRNKELIELNEKIEKANEELKIEAALEKVRSRTNAMHRSESLHEVINEVNDQLRQLGFQFDSTDFLTDYSDKGYNLWVANFPAPIYVPAIDHKVFHLLKEAIKRGDNFFTFILTTEEKNIHFKNVFENTIAKNSSEELKQYVYSAKGMATSCVVLKNIILSVTNFASVPYTDRENEILKRFAFVFEQSYTRFLDLQRAEAQAREARIEAALERVRSRSMAMHKSDELREVVAVLFAQLQHIGFDIKFCTIALIDKVNSTVEFWLSGFSQEILPESYHVPNLDHPFYQNFQNTFRQGIPYKVFELAGEEKRSYDKLWFTLTDFKNLPEPVKKPMMEMDRVVLSCAFTKNGMIQIGGFEPLSDSDASTVQRFSKVFEQTYTRFLDLQKAEAQAREAQIQLAMERVRARTMAMQRSEELAEVATVLFQQVKALGVSQWVCGFSIWEIGDNEFTWYPGGPDGEILAPCKVPLTVHPVFISMNESRLRGDELFVYEKEGELQADHYRYMISIPGMRKQLQNFLDAGLSIPTFQIDHIANFSHGNLTFITYEHFPEMHDIFKRFAKVFEQTYTRFLDLQKAEAQAREAQIEAALERVRSKTMAMQRSEELDSVIKSVYSELKHLDVSFDRCFIMIFDEQKGATWWMGSPEDDLFHEGFYVQYHTHPPHLAYLKGWEERQQKWEYLLGGQIKKDWDEFIFNKTELSKLPPIAIQYMKSFDSAHLAASFENFGCMTTGGQERLSEESFSILSRFAKVFDQTYTRFNDLKQAEAQARESQIEAALEKIRSRSLAMHQSKELKEVIAITFEKLNELNVLLGTVAIQLFDKKSMHSVVWVGNTIQDPQMVDLPYDKQMMLEDTLVKDSWQAMINGVDIINKEYSVEQKNKYFNYLFSNNNLTQIPEQAREVLRQMQQHIACLFVEKNSAFLVDSWRGEFFPKENLHVLKRAAKVFEQAYIRFLDLQKAEAQAREAQIEAALERVRSRTMAMQKSDELKDVIQVVYEQFVHLNVNVEHTGFIMDYKERNDMHIWLADKHAVPFQVTIPYFDCAHWNSFNEAKEKGIDFFANKLSFEEKNKFYQDLFKLIPDLPEETLEYYFSCPGLAISTVLLDNVGLYIENFSGISYSDEENATLMRFGKVFQQTYTRFKDLKLAEAHAVQAEEDLIKLQTEKKRAEDALSELQLTQRQLIQSEKMASLGELTAGIAHEIQNPLNFVNNFSDVNKELLIEMKEEIERGNLEEVKIIANDIISNEEKINHHGKRADAIVKGMLQHSRSSSGVKEPTDINELADEYLRLAYHGLRAKDKTFNATMKTDFDEKIGKVNVIPQEIGRVFLNLITNAFYVVAEKKKQLANGYEPTVTVTTKKESDKVVVSVKDNGNGIPQKVLDKIFQPFFTTKPTGQGTGLGLSLSYDIVKAHSGEIKVKTKDGEGSEFVIQLPIDQ